MKVIISVVAVLAAIALVPLLAIITFVGVTSTLLSCGTAGSTATLTSAPGDLATFLAAIVQHESGGNYTAHSPTSTASGAYQFIDTTWASEARAAGFSQYAGMPAAVAPPAVQDAVAGFMAQAIYNSPAGAHSFANTAGAWYLGHVPTASEMDFAPPGNGGLTPRAYEAAILTIMAKSAPATLLSAQTPAPAVGPSGVQKLISDMGPNTVHPAALPAGYSFYAHAELDNPTPPVGMNATTAWGTVWTEQGGSNATNTRVEVANEQLWLWSKSQARWVEAQASAAPTGGDYLNPSSGPFDNGSEPADTRTEADGGTSVKIIPSAWFHFWPAQGRVQINQSDIGGAFTTFSARLVLDQANGPDDRAQAHFVAAAGADWWGSVDSPWPNNAQIAYGGFSEIGTGWASYTANTMGAQIATNPPPFTGSGNAALTAACTPPAAPGGPVLVSAGSLAAVWPQVLTFLEAQLGKPYLWGGTGPDRWDCSGLVQAAFASAGIRLPRTSEQQFAATAASGIRYDQAQPGDLLFSEGIPPGHVRVYIGNGLAIAAPFTGAFVRIEKVDPGELTGVTVP